MNGHDLFEKSGLKYRFRAEEPAAWDAVYAAVPYRPVAYLGSSLDYQLSYQQGFGGDWMDLSSILYSDNRPVGIWPLSISYQDGKALLSSQGQPVMPPLFSESCPAKTRKNYSTACLELAGEFAKMLDLKTWRSGSAFHGEAHFSTWHLAAMARGASCEVRHDLYVDLSLSIEQIRSAIRKSYRPLISSGERSWNIDFVRAPGDPEVWNEFRCLHAEVAGRVTRCQESWDIQHRCIEDDEAFLITLRDEAGRMVGGGYFSCSADEGSYAVAAYDRELFDKPLGHVVQYRAIEELKQRSCRWHRIGARAFASDRPPPNDKELSISAFKQGFASHVLPAYILEHPVIADRAHK